MPIEITKLSPITGKKNTMTIDCTMAEYMEWQDGHKLIQHAMPRASADQREFLLSGILPHEWNEMFKEDEKK